MKGRIKWFNDEKGWGFITPDEDRKSVFIEKKHIVDCGVHAIVSGMRVWFEVVDGPKGREARGVVIPQQT